MQYHTFDKDAVKNGKLVIQNNKLHYGAGVTAASAYYHKKVFSSGLYNYNVGSSVTYTLPAANLIDNLAINASQIYIDADDGLWGYKSVTFSKPSKLQVKFLKIFTKTSLVF